MEEMKDKDTLSTQRIEFPPDLQPLRIAWDSVRSTIGNPLSGFPLSCRVKVTL